MTARSDTAPSKSVFGFIWYFLKKQWIKFLLIQILFFAWSLDQTIFPYIFGKIIDGFTNYVGDRGESWGVLKGPILAALFLWLGIEISFRIAGLIMSFAFPRLEKEIRMYLFAHMHDHSHTYFSDHFAGNISTKISDMVDNTTDTLMQFITVFIPTLLAVGIVTLTFYSISGYFASLILGWIVIHLGISFAFATRCTHFSERHAKTRSKLNGRIVDSLTNYFSVKIFANKRFELAYIGNYQKKEQQQNKEKYIYIEKIRLVLGALTFIGPGLALNTYAYLAWANHEISIGDIVIVFTTSWNIIMMVWHVSIELPNFFKQFGICKQALQILKDPIHITDKENAKTLEVSRGEIQFQEVYFHYRNALPLFMSKSVTIEPGQKVGLVGYSGSGKTTFVNLILRLFDIQGGHILIDGQDISKVTQDSLHRAITMIPQDPSLFHRTIRDNIRYGLPEASDELVISAAKNAHAHEFIMDLPHGYDTFVGERGIKLSGGQRQRIAIARAFLKNAPILILDEATSALDSHTEAQIQESLSHLMEGRTTIVIAHRLSTLLGMNRILVFEKGRIVEDSSHDALLKKKGLYYSLWHSQVEGFLAEAK